MDIKTIIENAYEARGKDDIDGLMAAFHPDGTFELAGSKALTTVAGASKGHRELRETFAGLITNFQFIQRDIVSFVIDGERACVHSRGKLRLLPRDRTVTTDLVDLWKFEDGKVVELIEFADTALVNDLMR